MQFCFLVCTSVTILCVQKIHNLKFKLQCHIYTNIHVAFLFHYRVMCGLYEDQIQNFSRCLEKEKNLRSVPKL